ncbi:MULTISPECIES: hypothetical protein [unclassified Caballeronia]|uniref:hypothetical protein n=1 Tax=unclassified Caballeronia TaxID=2646786 RepID=UPI00285C714A|nr:MULTISPECIES: hypothetical protein [unclassified Caballeronia]MDR5777261.1 hypothetical protein [Caballeronia sp. LZ002]MDR5798889.1 hypothetical protein [Caballeronia sp. LZ001]MDR5852699.1 hypothetical protein [Caballeronia sp. LZ003]
MLKVQSEVGLVSDDCTSDVDELKSHHTERERREALLEKLRTKEGKPLLSCITPAYGPG